VPDWLTHFVAAFLLATVLGIKEKEIVILGGLLPDIFKIYIITSLFFDSSKILLIKNFFAPLHTVIGVLLNAALVSTFFRDFEFKAFKLIMIGAVLHFLLDAILMLPYGKMVFELWPILIFDMEFGIFFDDSPIPLLIFSFLLALYLIIQNKL
jgi:hypothetical protein